MEVLNWWTAFLLEGGNVAGSALSGRMITAICSAFALAAALWSYSRRRSILLAGAMSVLWANVSAVLCAVLVVLTGGSSEGPGLIFLPIVFSLAYTPLAAIIAVAAASMLAFLRGGSVR